MKHVVQVLFVALLFTGTSAVQAGEPNLRLSFPLGGEDVDCDGFFIVAHAEDLLPDNLSEIGVIELKSEVQVTECFDDSGETVSYARVDAYEVYNSDPARIEAVKPDAKDMLLKIFKPRKIPIVTLFICSGDSPDKIDIVISFGRKIDDGAWDELTPISVTVEPETP